MKKILCCLVATAGVLSLFGSNVEIVAREREDGWTRIGYVLRPSTSSYIRCELALPDPEKWDGRLWGHGNGGWAGRCLCLRGMDGDHSAHVQCDLGTSLWQKKGFPTPPEVCTDFFWRATHLMTVEAKRLVREFYGRDAHHAYFTGASTGGRQAMSEAYLFPSDYDGIVSEVPYFNQVDAAAFAWRSCQLKKRYGVWFSAAEQATIQRVELAVCSAEGPDWARGRFIVDPRPTPEQLDACWREIVRTDPHLAGREKLWRELFEPVVVKGRPLACGAAIGMEFLINWPFYYARIFGSMTPDRATEETLLDFADRMTYNRLNPDLSAFRQNGGKLLFYAGYEDVSVPTPPVTAFYEALARNMGGFEKVQKFARYFTVPGRTHGAPGAAFGHGQIGQPPEIEQKLIAWVERGEAPEELEFTFAARQARMAVSAYPKSTVRLVPESDGERHERTEVRPLSDAGEVLEGVTFNGVSVKAKEGVATLRGTRRTAKMGEWAISSEEIRVPGEPARVFTLTVRNTGKQPAEMILRSDPTKMAWLRHADGATISTGILKTNGAATFYGGHILTDSPHARWFLGKFTEDGDGLFIRSREAPLP